MWVWGPWAVPPYSQLVIKPRPLQTSGGYCSGIDVIVHYILYSKVVMIQCPETIRNLGYMYQTTTTKTTKYFDRNLVLLYHRTYCKYHKTSEDLLGFFFLQHHYGLIVYSYFPYKLWIVFSFSSAWWFMKKWGCFCVLDVKCWAALLMFFLPQYSLVNEPLIELTNPGASGSLFYLTSDDEFIIKTVQHKEAKFLQRLLPGYYMVRHSTMLHEHLSRWQDCTCSLDNCLKLS